MVEPAEQWIPAAQARQLVGDSFDDCVAICTRANAGLIKARAELVVTGGRKFKETLLPVEFWWAQGHAALEQNWATGDFSTWIDSANQWRAFGVHFALDGLLQRRGRKVRVNPRALIGKSPCFQRTQPFSFADH